MKIDPPKRRRRLKPVALVVPGSPGTVSITTEHGEKRYNNRRHSFDALAALAGFAVYTTGAITALRHTTGATTWEGRTWRGRCTSMKLDGAGITVHSLRGALDGSTDPYRDLVAAIGWLNDRGVGAGSVSGMGWNLWRGTLTDTVTIASSPAVGRAALFGGRQGLREPTTFRDMAAIDLVSAYPHAMICEPYALGLRKVSPQTKLDPETAGIAEATVTVDPDLPFGVVPRRLAPDMIDFPFGAVLGRWAWRELAAAVELGCSVDVHQCWAPTVETDLFGGDWPGLVVEARELPKYPARIVKTAINSTWGQFGMNGDDRKVVRWEDDTGLRSVKVELPATQLPHVAAAHVAAETAARVRVRMLLEGLFGDWPVPAHHDTDGVIVRATAARELPTEAIPGQWRVKAQYPRIEFRAPQVYRATCSECDDPTARKQTHPRWHYVTAGTPAAAARELFRKIGQAGTLISFRGTDVVVPALPTHNLRGQLAGMRLARSQIGALQGAD